jgi:hypothetical protein
MSAIVDTTRNIKDENEGKNRRQDKVVQVVVVEVNYSDKVRADPLANTMTKHERKENNLH